MDDELTEIDEMAEHAGGRSLFDDISTIVSDFGLDESVAKRARKYVKASGIPNKLSSGLFPRGGSDQKPVMRYLAAFVVHYFSQEVVQEDVPSTEMCLVIVLPPGGGHSFAANGGDDPRIETLSLARAGWVGPAEEAQPAIAEWRMKLAGGVPSVRDTTGGSSPSGAVDVVVMTSREVPQGLGRDSLPSARAQAVERLLQSGIDSSGGLEVFSGLSATDEALLALDPWRW